MKRGMIALLATMSMAALLASGCANTEKTVATETPMAQTVKPVEPTTPAKPSETPVTAVDQTKQIVAAAPQQADMKPANGKSVAEAAFDTIYFDFDKSDLSQAARDALTKNAAVMQNAQPNVKIKIEGHCDERGSAEYNLALGERRAKSALQYLLTLGIKSDRLSIISYGKEKPAVQGSDEAAWAKNRRAEFTIVK